MGTYFLAADVSKGYADFTILNEKKEVVLENFQLDDTFEGQNQLYHILVSFVEEHPECKIYSAVESTGGYEDNWLNFLEKLSYELPLKAARLNPREVSYTRRAEIKRNVTDKISAKAIGYHLINTLPDIDFKTNDPYSNFKSIWTHIHMLIKQKTQLLNQFESYLYKSHPQLLPHCKNKVSQWILKLVRKYPTAKHLSNGKVENIASIPYITKEKASKLKKSAERSVASSTDDAMAELLSDISERILSYGKKIKKWKQKLEDKCNMPEIELLTTIPNVSEYIAAGLMLNMGSVEKFDDVKALISYWGLHPEFKESGDSKKEIGMSKRGRTVPRELLFNAVFASLPDDNYIRERYDYYVEEKGKNGMCAIGIMMHKLARIIYGMLRSGTEYNPKIDKRNRKKNQSTNLENNLPDNARRYQKYDSMAPVSSREDKRRKERMETQDAYAPFSGSSNPSSSNSKLKNKDEISNEKLEFDEVNS